MSKTDTSGNQTRPTASPTVTADSQPAKSVETGAQSAAVAAPKPVVDAPRPKEIGGPKGPEPTRFGDWERDGRCVDF